MLKIQGLETLEEIRAFVVGSQPLGFDVPVWEDLHDWHGAELCRFGYRARFRGLESPPTIKRFCRLIRAVLAYEEQCLEPLQGTVEYDETMFGGRRPVTRGWGAAGKVNVLGILRRDGQVRVFPVQGRSGAELSAW